MTLASDIVLLSDGQLDSVFAAYYDAGDNDSAMTVGAEIRSRLATVSGFFSGLIGGHAFPLYEARTNFSQAGAAQSSVSTSASNLAAKAGDAIKTGLGALGGGVTVALILAGIVYFGLLRKK